MFFSKFAAAVGPVGVVSHGRLVLLVAQPRLPVVKKWLTLPRCSGYSRASVVWHSSKRGDVCLGLGASVGCSASCSTGAILNNVRAKVEGDDCWHDRHHELRQERRYEHRRERARRPDRQRHADGDHMGGRDGVGDDTDTTVDRVRGCLGCVVCGVGAADVVKMGVRLSRFGTRNPLAARPFETSAETSWRASSLRKRQRQAIKDPRKDATTT